MSILLCFLTFLFRKQLFEKHHWYGKTYFLLSIILIGLGEYWCRPVGLAWHDVPYNYTYRINAKTEDGSEVLLPKEFFSPYDFQFTLGDFKNLNSEPLFRIIMGASDASTSHYFNIERPVKDLFKDELILGNTHTDLLKRQNLKSLFQHYISNWNNSTYKSSVLPYMKAPRLLWTYPTKVDLKGNGKITEVSIIEVTSLFSKSRGYEVLREREVFMTPIIFIQIN